MKDKSFNPLSLTAIGVHYSEFYNAAREFDKGQITLNDIENKLNSASNYLFDDNGTFSEKPFYDYLEKSFNKGDGSGYYGWHGVRYFLYEYELSLLADSRQQKVNWEDLLKTPKDKISIEHIYPQTPNNDYWNEKFEKISNKEQSFYQDSLGNLLLLSTSINSSLQNDSFDNKKQPKFENEKKLEMGILMDLTQRLKYLD